MRKLALLMMLVAALLVGVSAVAAQDAPTQTIAELVVASAGAETPEFSILLAAVGAANPAILEALSSADNQLTVFAPTDAAFADLLAALETTPEDLLANTNLLNVVLQYHIVPAMFDAAAIVQLDGALVGTQLPDAPLAISVMDGTVMVNGATVVAADVMATNGVVHVIDQVLVPADAMERAEAMGMMAEATPMPDASAPQTIGEIAIGLSTAEAPEFTTLVAAVGAADASILALITGSAQITVFAPVDAAFAAAAEMMGVTPADVLADQGTVNRILAYHVVPGSFSAAAVVAAAEAAGEEGINVATYLPGTTLNIRVMDGAVMVNNATVAQADVMASNGVIHVIDAVLLPPQAGM
jgi:uncharacterized surface protein with fasciclin (FAS1) repeats